MLFTTYDSKLYHTSKIIRFEFIGYGDFFIELKELLIHIGIEHLILKHTHYLYLIEKFRNVICCR